MKTALFALAAFAATTAMAEPVKLKTDSGVLVGESQDGVSSFKGFPYAKPPVGDLRWRPPQRVSWDGERDATRFALPCPQPAGADGRANGGGVSGPTSEDCLYMNVWVPKNARNAPVMLWLYGGAGYLGAGHLGSYNGASFARQGVIVVTLNYRLGMLGNYAHPALTKAAPAGEPLVNYALMDAIAGLEGVQRIGRALGADPQNVTRIGQSAGGLMVSALLAAPPAKGLCQKALIHSGTFFGGGRNMTDAAAARHAPPPPTRAPRRAASSLRRPSSPSSRSHACVACPRRSSSIRGSWGTRSRRRSSTAARAA